MRYKLLTILLLIAVPAIADCPYSIACPYDGDSMSNTWNCKGIGESRACQFRHSKTTFDNGQPKTVTHETWASCPS